MPQDTQSLATLIGSRICHDLISPVGAIQNGIELLTMEGRAGPEMALIEESVANASARIRFMRVAFGAAGGGQSVGETEIRATLDDMGRSGRVHFEWDGGPECPRDILQTIFLAMLCLESAMPRGGAIRASQEEKDWLISGPTEADKPNSDLWTGLCAGSSSTEGVLPAHVQFPLLAALLNDRGLRVRVAKDGEAQVIRLPR